MRTMFTLITILITGALFGGMLGMQALGRRLGERDRRSDPDRKEPGHRAGEGAVIALLGLLIAFTFSGAGSRFDLRRQQIVEERNAIEKAWLRIDLLPADRQPEIRELFRRYVDTRLETFRSLWDMPLFAAASARGEMLQRQIWSASVAAVGDSRSTLQFMVLEPLNEMIDIAATRTAAARRHPPVAVFLVLAVLTLVAAMFAGYGMAGEKVVSGLHRFGFPLVMSLAVFLILNFEFPRLGLISIHSMDQVMVDLRHSMN